MESIAAHCNHCMATLMASTAQYLPLWHRDVACLEFYACQEWEQPPSESSAQPSCAQSGRPRWGWWVAGEGVGAAARWAQAVAKHTSLSAYMAQQKHCCLQGDLHSN